MQWYLKVLSQYADFSGRARRTEYWMFVLFNVIALTILTIVDYATGLTFGQGGLGVLGAIYALAVLIPGIAVQVRRLHDTDRSGFWWFLNLIPLVGPIVLLVFYCLDGTPSANRFGADPKQEERAGLTAASV